MHDGRSPFFYSKASRDQIFEAQKCQESAIGSDKLEFSRKITIQKAVHYCKNNTKGLFYVIY